jgi:hypothetical protein
MARPPIPEKQKPLSSISKRKLNREKMQNARKMENAPHTSSNPFLGPFSSAFCLSGTCWVFLLALYLSGFLTIIALA